MRHTADRIGIYRLCDLKRGGDYLHVVLRRNGKTFNKEFFEKRCGGEQRTLQLAQAWRDSIIDAHPAMTVAQFCAIVRSNNTSGVPGVIRNDKRSSKGKPVPRIYWHARIPLGGGKYRYQNFSVNTFGEEEAKRLAIAARLQGLRDLDALVFRIDMQPKPVSSQEDIELLEAALSERAERLAKRSAQATLGAELRSTKRQLTAQITAQRAADRLAQSQAEEQATLKEATNRSGEPYIGRYMTSENNGNWRVSLIRQGTRHRKTFSDSVYGGAGPALLAAKAWRDQLFLTLPAHSKAQKATRINTTNTSGVAGVHRSRERHVSPALEYWVAHSPKEKGRPGRTRKFSIAKYGDEQAFSLAVQAREAFVAELQDAQYLHHRAARKLLQTIEADADEFLPQGANF
ncbi:MAG: AP2/ERF family transcription factor [Pseudomonadota bacterium]